MHTVRDGLNRIILIINNLPGSWKLTYGTYHIKT